jgi:uncharacterized protein DUF6894
MPRYFFNVRQGTEYHRDEEGQEFGDTEAARHEAMSLIREMIGEKVLHGGSVDHRTIEIADEAGMVLETVTSREVLFGPQGLRTFRDDVTQSAPKPQP